MNIPKIRMKNWLQVMIASSYCILVMGCTVLPHFTHDLPLTYRTALYDANSNDTIDACRLALVEQGYTVACTDSISGIIFTDYLDILPDSHEIGGVWRTICLVRVVELKDKTMVIAEIVVEGDEWPMNVERAKARSLYMSLFKNIQKQLDQGEDSDGVRGEVGD
jgi:hypothetical protein